ncbi:hypothetical protein J437_LFUL014819 [Ladona fulva]|uniref:G-protein coupled receptors family 2 profile 2 domain-containing protein n=1 Tax=Ladona fulva TaxID=123851 RepID=A0A8K0KXH9_LADFU|nr:hypothetical protein J437_LFUL014819 [Ladona fulva]
MILNIAKKESSESVHANERKKFIIYSIYAWSCTSMIVLISLIMDFADGIPDHYFKPRFGRSRCWFDRKIEAFFYFYCPFSILISCNIIMYIVTAVKVFQLKKMMKQRNNPHLKTRLERDNHIRFKLYLKLLLIMGIIWVTEIIGWAIDGPDYYWYLADVINCLQGVLIFIMFVWQKRVRKIVVLKLCPQVGERQSTGWSFFDKCCMVNQWSPSRASETRDISLSAILAPPKDNIQLKPMEETSKMNANNDEAT